MKLRLKLCNIVTFADFIGKIGGEPASVEGSSSYSQNPSPDPMCLYRRILHCLLLPNSFNDPLCRKEEVSTGPL